MRRIFLLAILLAAIPALRSMAKPEDPAILSLDSAKVTLVREKPRLLLLEATGKVPTGGWTNGRLQRVIPLFPPKDGIYDVKVMAAKPDDPASSDVAPVAVKALEWRLYPLDVKAVRFQAEKNCIVAVLPGVDKASIDAGSCAKR
jgi:hypothetical protein